MRVRVPLARRDRHRDRHQPSATGEWIIVPMVDYIRVRIDTYTSGDIRACLAARQGPPKIW